MNFPKFEIVFDTWHYKWFCFFNTSFKPYTFSSGNVDVCKTLTLCRWFWGMVWTLIGSIGLFFIGSFLIFSYLALPYYWLNDLIIPPIDNPTIIVGAILWLIKIILLSIFSIIKIAERSENKRLKIYKETGIWHKTKRREYPLFRMLVNALIAMKNKACPIIDVKPPKKK